MTRAAVAAALLFGAGACSAQVVSMSGRLGDKALLVIDGVPRTVAVGATQQGVRLVSVTADESVVEIGGKRATLRLGGAQVNLGARDGGDSGATKVMLSAGSGGHFTGNGTINGKAVTFMVDTGATTVALSQSEAERIGLRYQDGQRGLVNTAGGGVVAWRVRLQSVRLGAVQVYDVEALVVPAEMGYVLLGNSFLSRFQMKRENDVMTLEKRY